MDEHIRKIAEEINFSPLKNVGGNIYLNDEEIRTLKNFNINYENCMNLSELISKIEFACEEFDYDLELEEIAKTISERNYYMNTKK